MIFAFVGGILFAGLAYLIVNSDIPRRRAALQARKLRNIKKAVRYFDKPKQQHDDIDSLVAHSHGACKLYDFIRSMQSEYCEYEKSQSEDISNPIFNAVGSSWGTILDAGTGEHSLSFLIALKREALVDRWSAITGDHDRQKRMKTRFGRYMMEGDELIANNWLNPSLLKNQVFDVVLADYLLGSLDGFSPYFQIDLFRRLRPHVGKRLYVVGLEPFPVSTTEVPAGSLHAILLVEIARARDSAIRLSGKRPYREFPLETCKKLVERAQFKIEKVAKFETIYSESFVRGQLEVGYRFAQSIDNFSAREGMLKYLDQLDTRISNLKWNIPFGYDYVIVAKPM